MRARSSGNAQDLGKPVKPRREGRDELTVERPILEAEVMGLRQLLAEVKASRDELRHEMDDLRRDRDHWQRLAEQAGPTPPGAARRAWFCGRASQGR
jgi:uncharacterized coiled-coil DUF342 family protein